jgi:CRP-like cAMP-binding protein
METPHSIPIGSSGKTELASLRKLEEAVMGAESIHRALADFAFAEELNPHQRQLLAGGARPFEVRRGGVLAHQGDPAHAFYLIVDGFVTLWMDASAGNTVLVLTRGPGQPLGYSWLVPPHRWQLEVRAEGEVRGYCFEAQWLRDLCARDHDLAYVLVRYLFGEVVSVLQATRRTDIGGIW